MDHKKLPERGSEGNRFSAERGRVAVSGMERQWKSYPQTCNFEVRCPASVFQVQSEGRNVHRTAILVESRIDDVLKSWRCIYSTPEVGSVVSLEDIFATVGEGAVADDESVTAVGQVGLMIARD